MNKKILSILAGTCLFGMSLLGQETGKVFVVYGEWFRSLLPSDMASTEVITQPVFESIIRNIPWMPGSPSNSVVQVQRIFNEYDDFTFGTNLALSVGTVVEGFGNLSGLRAYRYINEDNSQVSNQLIFATQPVGWEIGDVVSVTAYNNKYPNCAAIASIDDNVVTFSNNLPFNIVLPDSGFDHHCAYVLLKPTLGDVDLGFASHAEGVNSMAIGPMSHAEGRETKAFGQYSHTEGRETSAQYGSHAEGAKTTASGNQSHAEGYNTTASGADSHAEGAETKATAYTSHAEGYNTTSSSSCTHAEGAGTEATSGAAHAEGDSTHATGYASHAEGIGTTASGKQSHAEGMNTVASAPHTHAEGTNTLASVTASHAEGDGTQALAYASHVEGINTIAGGRASHAAGERATAGHNNSYSWNGNKDVSYMSNGTGTFNINPKPASGNDPATGFFVGGKSLREIVEDYMIEFSTTGFDYNGNHYKLVVE